MDYRQLVLDVAHKSGTSPDDARAAADATIATLAQTVAEPQRQRLLETVPAAVGKDADAAPGRAPDADSFVAEVSWLTGAEPEQARYRAQAVLSTLAEHEPGLVDDLAVPDDLRGIFADPQAGDGITGPMTDAEVASGINDLPYWEGDHLALRRTLVLPKANLDRVLDHLEDIKRDTGRGPEISRTDDTAVFTVRTHATNAVTAQDIDLAHRIEAKITEAAAGIA